MVCKLLLIFQYLILERAVKVRSSRVRLSVEQQMPFPFCIDYPCICSIGHALRAGRRYVMCWPGSVERQMVFLRARGAVGVCYQGQVCVCLFTERFWHGIAVRGFCAANITVLSSSGGVVCFFGIAFERRPLGSCGIKQGSLFFYGRLKKSGQASLNLLCYACSAGILSHRRHPCHDCPLKQNQKKRIVVKNAA